MAEKEEDHADDSQLPTTQSIADLPQILAAVPCNPPFTSGEYWQLELRWKDLDVSVEIADRDLDSELDFAAKFNSAVRGTLLSAMQRDYDDAYARWKRRNPKLESYDEEALAEALAKRKQDPGPKPPSYADITYEQLPPVEDDVWQAYVELIRQKGGRGQYRTELEIEAENELNAWLEVLPEKLAAERTRLNNPMRSLHRDVETFVFGMVLKYVIPGHINEFAVLSRIMHATRGLSGSKLLIDMDQRITASADRAHREYERTAAKQNKKVDHEAGTEEPGGPVVELLKVVIKGRMRSVTTQHGAIELPRKHLESFKKFRDDFANEHKVYYQYVHYQKWNSMIERATNSSLLEFETKTVDGVKVASLDDADKAKAGEADPSRK
jgi:hypothetical protein